MSPFFPIVSERSSFKSLNCGTLLLLFQLEIVVNSLIHKPQNLLLPRRIINYTVFYGFWILIETLLAVVKKKHLSHFANLIAVFPTEKMKQIDLLFLKRALESELLVCIVCIW